MTDSTAPGLSEDFAAIGAARAEQDAARRRQNIRRGLAAAAVAAVHVLALLLIMVGNEVPLIQRIRETIPEAITWIPMPKKVVQPHRVEPAPVEVQEPLPVLTAPITVPPIHSRPMAQPQTDGILGVGRALACGAGNYENLPPSVRDQCRRHPWAFVKKPDGTIVLEAPPKPVDVPTTADIMRHEQETAPPCPVLQNVPCLGKVMHGDGIGGPSRPF